VKGENNNAGIQNAGIRDEQEKHDRSNIISCELITKWRRAGI
jgi:hypothetical protein